MREIDVSGAKKILARIAVLMEKNRDRLSELDKLMGDGDLGASMSAGFSEAAKDTAENDDPSPGHVFMRSGMGINSHAPCTMGSLMATGFMRGGMAVLSKPTISVPDVATFFEAFLEGVIERGKAKPGEKTIIDVLLPAIAALREATELPLPEAMGKALAEAEKGMEEGKALQSVHGKAAALGEKSIGIVDPGSAAMCLVFKGFADVAGS